MLSPDPTHQPQADGHDHDASEVSPRAVLIGLGSTLAVALCTLWLAAVGHLDLYINPRYNVFTVILSAIAVAASTAGLVSVLRHRHRAHGVSGRRSRIRRVGAVLATLVVVALSLGMLVLPPSTLSARTAQERTVETGSLSSATGSTGTVALLGSGSIDTKGYGVKDWASLIRQTTDTSSLIGTRLTLTGFVVPSNGGQFTLTRFVISCCAVDAQPVGVEVLPRDGAVQSSGAWVQVTGALVANPDVAASNQLVIRPTNVRVVAQPKDPYEY